MNNWANNSIFYHIYPLGFCGALYKNDFSSPPNFRLGKLCEWISHLKEMQINAIYLGPIFESEFHGYDVIDYFMIDRRLGKKEDIQYLVKCLHEAGIKVVLDGVFNHCSRLFWAFRDILQNGQSSRFIDWFYDIDFTKRSPYNDPFSYESWNGYFNLVKFNLKNVEVKSHLFHAIETWISDYDIDGLRLDCADCLDFTFIEELSTFVHKRKNDFWMVGEVIHGDYTKWVNSKMLESVTNYECYKGLWSSLNDNNFFEIAYSLKRQFGNNGIYKGFNLYNFIDNHDVNRIASTIKNPSHLYLLYGMLFCIPGIPSIYYGSEWGIKGVKSEKDDSVLRPNLELYNINVSGEYSNLVSIIKKLAQIRKSSTAFSSGDYEELFLSHNQFAFMRTNNEETIIPVFNSSSKEVLIKINIPSENGNRFVDMLDESYTIECNNNILEVKLFPNWCRILKKY